MVVGRGQEGVVKSIFTCLGVQHLNTSWQYSVLWCMYFTLSLPLPLLQSLDYITAPYTQLPKVAEELQSKIRFPDKGPCKHTHTCAPLHTHT